VAKPFTFATCYSLMITIISGTNRKDSMTLRVAQHYLTTLQELGADTHLLSLEDMNVWEENPRLTAVQQEWLIPSDKFVFIMPEYNGSFPGILKLLIDNSDIKRCWWYKKAALVGVADGRGGNLRGIEHMTNILHYLRMNVHYNKLPLSRINDEMNEEGIFQNRPTIAAIRQQMEEFINY
jgi:chromate reductase